MNITIIGITDSPRPFFPPEVLQAVSAARFFSGGRRHHLIVAPLLPTGAEWIDITTPLEAVFSRYRQLCTPGGGPDGGLVVFASGDPLFFGFANTVRRLMPEARVRLFPAFNSLQLLAHRLLLPYHDMRVVSLTGRPWPALDTALIERVPMIGVLTDRQHTPAAIARRLLDYGFTAYTMHVGEHLGNPALERVSSLSLQQAADAAFDQPNCLILSARDPGVRPFGVPDSDFELLDGREKMITKMPLRLLTLQALELSRRSVLWDVGFCTGSVSIEARLQFPRVQVVAFEVRPQCEAIISANARRHGAPGITVVMGDFLGADLAAVAAQGRPDAIFIGGHGGRLKELMARAAEWLAPGGVMVMNSVTSAVVDQATAHRPGSRQLFDEACRELGLSQEPPLSLQLNHHNPIDLLKCRK